MDKKNQEKKTCQNISEYFIPILMILFSDKTKYRIYSQAITKVDLIRTSKTTLKMFTMNVRNA